MTDRESLLRAILADPAADLPRLVFADWLDEHGEEQWASFIRLQCEQVRLANYRPRTGVTTAMRDPMVDWRERWDAVKTAAQQLLDANWLEWSGLADTGILVGRPWQDRITFSRGFPSSISLPLPAFLEHAGAIFRAHPVTAVRLTDRYPHLTNGRYYWTVSADAGLPHVISERLAGGPSRSNSEAEALAWLSGRCVAHGRHLANLPALPAPA